MLTKWLLETSILDCDLGAPILMDLAWRGVYCVYNQGDKTIHIHLWQIYTTVIATMQDFDLMMKWVLLDAMIHESIHAALHAINEHVGANWEERMKYDYEEALVSALMKNGKWTLD